jgi:hypothetical protein
MNTFEYEIAGIANVISILPQNGSWYYQYLENGNIRIHGKPFDANSFSSDEFEQKIISYGGSIINNNNSLIKKEMDL